LKSQSAPETDAAGLGSEMREIHTVPVRIVFDGVKTHGKLDRRLTFATGVSARVAPVAMVYFTEHVQ